jgi:hypothetical protein
MRTTGVTDVCVNRACKKRYWIAVVVLLCGLSLAEETSPKITINPDGKDGFTFDTGVLRGTLCPGGKLQGLTSVTHIPSGTRLDRSMGILSYYRVFTTGKRYGTGGWEWPATAERLSDTAVQVTAPATTDRPFDMAAVYRWKDPQTLDVETTVTAHQDLNKFESFLASYFDEAFPTPRVYVAESPDAQGQPGFLPARKSFGAWQMFPRDEQVVPIMQDGRWKLEPNPVDWVIMPRLAAPLCTRCGPGKGLTAILMAPPDDCFAIATPYGGEGHYSLYLSLFGRDLKTGATVKARARLVLAGSISDEQAIALYQQYLKEPSVP